MTTYKVIKYQDANDFLTHTKSELENDEIINTFPLWICDVKAGSDTNNYNQSYAALYQDDQLAYVLVCADGYSHVGWCGQQQQHIDTSNIPLIDAIKELLLTCVPSAQTMTLNGYSPVVNVFARIRKSFSTSSSSFTFGLVLNEIVGNDSDTTASASAPAPGSTLGPLCRLWSYQINNRQDILWTDVTRQLAERATLRRAVWMDHPLLVSWGDAFIRDCGLTDGDVWNRCAAVIQEGYAYFWCLEDNIPAAMVWKRRALRHGISLAYVYTPNENRGRGYAAAMVAQITQYLLDKEGYRYVTLLMDGARDPAKNMYTSVGYQLVGSMARLSGQEQDP